MNHPDEEQLVAYRFGDVNGDEAAEVTAHLRECRTCQAELEAVDVALAAAASIPVPERSASYGAEVWARLEPHLTREPWWRKLGQAFSVPRLAWAGGVAVLVLAAFAAGRMWPRPEAPGVMPAPAAPAVASAPGAAESAGPLAAEAGGEEPAVDTRGPGARERQVRREILLVAVGEHLERSQMALVELVNTTNGPEVDISAEQARAKDLVAENRLYRQTAADTGDAAIRSVLDDLERVLVEVANGPSELTKADFERVQQRIEAQGIIFKVRVLGERVREQKIRPAADGRIQG